MQKDQSYFLWTLTQNQLKHCLFPIGDYLKSEVRAIAKRAGLPTASKKDSQGICFLGKVTLADFLKEHIPAARGTVVNENGEVIGEHDGANFYTIGQRHGFTARSRRSEAGIKSDQRPHYIVQKNAAANTLVAVEGDDHPALYRKEIELGKVNLIDPALIDRSTNNQLTVWARVRYRQPLAKAMLVRGEDGTKIIFEKPQKFVAPGQSAVFYRTRRSRGGEGYEMLGGGVIAN